MKKLSPVALGMAIKAVRDSARMSATDLARQTEITASSLSRSENGLRAIELAEAVLICKVTGTSLDDLVEIATNMDRSDHLKVRENAIAELERSKASIKEMVDSVLANLKSQSSNAP